MTLLNKIKSTQKSNRPIVLFSILFSMVLLFVMGLMYAYAYYNKVATFPLLSSMVGDFELGDGDINIMIYIENDTGGYNLIKSIPSFGYILNNDLTECDASYTISDNKINVTATQKTTCKFYYSKIGDADIKLLIMVEDAEGVYAYDNKLYKQSIYIPAYGFEYANYSCTNDSVVSNINYDANTRNFTFDTTEKNICYAYFNSLGLADINIVIYIRDDLTTTRYTQVENIPSVKTYELSTTTSSYCQNKDGTTVESEISYTNGQIQVSNSSPETCYVYLDIVN